MRKLINKLKKNKISFGLICVSTFAVAILVCGLSIAYFTDRDVVTNTHKATEINIKLYEPEWFETGMAKAAAMEPGMIIEKDPYVYNDSDDDIYIRMQILIKVPDNTESTTGSADGTNTESTTGSTTGNVAGTNTGSANETNSGTTTVSTNETNSGTTTGSSGNDNIVYRIISQPEKLTTELESTESTIIDDAKIYDTIIKSLYCDIDGEKVNLVTTDEDGYYVSQNPTYVFNDGWFYYKINSADTSSGTNTDNTDNTDTGTGTNAENSNISTGTNTDNTDTDSGTNASNTGTTSDTNITYIKIPANSNAGGATDPDTLFDYIEIPVLKSEYYGIFDSGLQIEVVAQAISASSCKTDDEVLAAFKATE